MQNSPLEQGWTAVTTSSEKPGMIELDNFMRNETGPEIREDLEDQKYWLFYDPVFFKLYHGVLLGL